MFGKRKNEKNEKIEKLKEVICDMLYNKIVDDLWGQNIFPQRTYITKLIGGSIMTVRLINENKDERGYLMFHITDEGKIAAQLKKEWYHPWENLNHKMFFESCEEALIYTALVGLSVKDLKKDGEC